MSATNPNPAGGQCPDTLLKACQLAHRWADEVEDTTRVMIEFGAFTAASATPKRLGPQLDAEGRVIKAIARAPQYRLPRILGLLASARADIASGNPNEARRKLGLAEGLVHQPRPRPARARYFRWANWGRDWWWRFTRVHQGHLVIYHVGVTLVLLNIATGWWGFGRIADEVWGVPIEVLGFGALGATLRGFFWLYRKVQTKTFRPQFTVFHLTAPAIGALFALLTYVLFLGGLGALSAPPVGEAQVEAWLPYALALLAGFSWEWALQRLDPLIRPSRPDAPEPAQDGQATDDSTESGSSVEE